MENTCGDARLHLLHDKGIKVIFMPNSPLDLRAITCKIWLTHLTPYLPRAVCGSGTRAEGKVVESLTPLACPYGEAKKAMIVNRGTL